MPERRLTRRTLVAATASATLGLAGCIGGSAPAADDETDAGGGTHTDGGHHEETEHHDETDHHEETESGHHEEETSHDDSHGHGGVPEGPSPTATVEMVTKDGGYHFSPHVVWVEAGGTVTFENVAGSHATAAYAPANDRPNRIPSDAEAWDSGILSAEGATFEVTLDTPGVYDYYCEPHEGLGMLGSIIVGEPDAHGQPGLAEPQDSFSDTVSEKLHSLNETVNEALGHTH